MKTNSCVRHFYMCSQKFASIILLIAVAILFSACKNETQSSTEAPSKPTKPTRAELAEQAMKHARQIVSDPSNWKNNTVPLTDLGGIAQDLGLADTQEFKEFDLAAQNLIRFGTTWISSLDDGIKSRLGTELSRITERTDATLRAQVPVGAQPIATDVGGRVNINTTQVVEDQKAGAERAIFTHITSLRAADAKEFGDLFARGQTTYRALRLVLLKTKDA